jgi:hypothetical protein
MSPSQIIQEAIDKLQAYKKSVGTGVGIDAKWTNRTLSHLDNAYAASKLIVRAGSLAAAPEASVPSETCSCPTGAVDSNCPVHGQK